MYVRLYMYMYIHWNIFPREFFPVLYLPVKHPQMSFFWKSLPSIFYLMKVDVHFLRVIQFYSPVYSKGAYKFPKYVSLGKVLCIHSTVLHADIHGAREQEREREGDGKGEGEGAGEWVSMCGHTLYVLYISYIGNVPCTCICTI